MVIKHAVLLYTYIHTQAMHAGQVPLSLLYQMYFQSHTHYSKSASNTGFELQGTEKGKGYTTRKPIQHSLCLNDTQKAQI